MITQFFLDPEPWHVAKVTIWMNLQNSMLYRACQFTAATGPSGVLMRGHRALPQSTIPRALPCSLLGFAAIVPLGPWPRPRAHGGYGAGSPRDGRCWQLVLHFGARRPNRTGKRAHGGLSLPRRHGFTYKAECAMDIYCQWPYICIYSLLQPPQANLRS